MLSSLILVKHAMPVLVPTVPAADWRLGDEGREGARRLAATLAELSPVAVISSVEPKASETATILAERLELPWAALAGLHEHERRSAAFGSRAEFEASIRDLFARPDELVFGDETARHAQTRFAAAVESALATWSPAAAGEAERSLVIVAHGTVIALLCAAWWGVDPFPLWQRLGLPSGVNVSLPDRRLLEIIS